MEYKELDDLIHSLKDAVESTNPQKGYWKELWSEGQSCFFQYEFAIRKCRGQCFRND